ncbi:MAG: histidine phosphatase family protein [Lentisphaerae bacterium]|nr:histidine phosphatase family protein [Lentisphaerota bacterium]
MIVTVVRHGQTVANETNTIQGQSDTALNPLGIKQAHCVAKRLQGVAFAAVYSSDLSRAMDTARIIAPEQALIPSPALREWNLGAWQGMSAQEVRERFPGELEAFLNDRPGLCVTGGETKSEVYERAAGFLRALPAKHAGQHVLVVSHCGLIRALLKEVMAVSGPWPRQPQVANASISRFVFDKGVWQLACWNDTAHLQGLESDRGNY